MRRIAGLRSTIGFLLVTVAGIDAGRAAEALAPYQMVRSLQLVQDRIASGDQAALPMQAKLLELTDARLRKVSAGDLKDPKNLRALLVYGMSGGNPATVRAATAHVEMDAGMKAISTGVLAYLGGRPADAIEALKPVDPMTLPTDLGAFVALVKGSLLAGEDPAQALALLDRARLLSPGTLVEEAALRRSVGITATAGDAPRFVHASTQYVERYLHSPYASQFADAFVSGVIAMNQAIGYDKLTDITAMMDAERAKVIYLRIARRAAIDGLKDLSAFAAARAGQERGKSTGEDPRALLYASLSAVTSATTEDLREKLKKIDRDRLSESDRALFDAASAVSREIAAPPPAPITPPAPPLAEAVSAPATPANGDTRAGSPTQAEPVDGLPPVEGAIAERPATQEPSGQSAEQPAVPQSSPADMAQPAAEAAPAGREAAEAGQPLEAADAAIADARRKLEQIDQMLGASPQ